MKVNVISFAYKDGWTDFTSCQAVWDVRFLTIPIYGRDLNGTHQRVQDLLFEGSFNANRVLDTMVSFSDEVIEAVLSNSGAEEDPVLEFAIGCTGGRYVSVAMVEHLASWITATAPDGVEVRALHRESENWPSSSEDDDR